MSCPPPDCFQSPDTWAVFLQIVCRVRTHELSFSRLFAESGHMSCLSMNRTNLDTLHAPLLFSPYNPKEWGGGGWKQLAQRQLPTVYIDKQNKEFNFHGDFRKISGSTLCQTPHHRLTQRGVGKISHFRVTARNRTPRRLRGVRLCADKNSSGSENEIFRKSKIYTNTAWVLPA